MSGSVDLAIELNLAAHVSHVARATNGMRVQEPADLVLVDSGLDGDTFNVVCRSRLTSASVSERIKSVVEHFGAGTRRAAFAQRQS